MVRFKRMSNSRLPAKALATLVEEVGEDETKDGLTMSKMTYSKEEVIYDRHGV